MREDALDKRGGWRSWLAVALTAGAAAVTIVALVLMLAGATRGRDAALRLQEYSSDRIILAATFEATMARSEAALGRFVISGDRALGTLYSDDWRSSGLLLGRLAAASRGDRVQQSRVVRLREAWGVRGRELADIAIRTTYKQNNEALSLYYTNRSSSALEQLTQGIDALIAHERGVLSGRSSTVDAQISRANMLTTLVSIVGVLVVAGAGWLGFAMLSSTQRRAREEQRAERLEEAVAERTAEVSASNERLIAEMATREDAEERLRQAQKMDAVGQLTGGIAHDFNNMLAVVLGGMELAKRRIADGKEDPVRHLDSAMEGASRAAALTKRLLAFARAEPLLPSANDPDALIAGMADLLDRTLGERIAVHHIEGGKGWPIFVDRHQFENVVLNLAVNARDAIEASGTGGGTLTIATAQVRLAVGDVADLSAGEHVRIAISDTGTGIDPAVLHRVFEPFFTTKAVDKGTGLGLSQVFGYMRQSHGAVTVDSTLGIGTTVSLYLPRHFAAAADALDVVPLAHESVPQRTLKLLVIEDDRRVLAATTDALVELGHTPIGCLTADEATVALRRNPDIDLVLSDVLMPGLTGPELLAALRAERPGLRALFVTGFTGDGATAEAFGSDSVLRKPFTLAALERALALAAGDAASTELETRAAA